MSYWASLEIEMSLLGKRLSAGQFIKESVRAVKKVVELLNKQPTNTSTPRKFGVNSNLGFDLRCELRCELNKQPTNTSAPI